MIREILEDIEDVNEANGWIKFSSKSYSYATDDYAIDLDFKKDGWNLWVEIQGSDKVSHEDMNLYSDDWNQEQSGYEIKGTSENDLKKMLKSLGANPKYK